MNTSDDSRVLESQARALMECYPRIYLACHSRHVRDPGSGAVVSQRQIQLLDHLDTVEPTGISDLAHHLGVTPSTISISVDRLEERGYAVRQSDSTDGRRVAVLLTSAGDRVRQAHSVLDADRVRELLSRLSEKDRDRALDGLELLARAATVPASISGE